MLQTFFSIKCARDGKQRGSVPGCTERSVSGQKLDSRRKWGIAADWGGAPPSGRCYKEPRSASAKVFFVTSADSPGENFA